MGTVLRRGRFGAGTAAVVFALLGGMLAPAAAQTADAARVIALVNATRASVGAPALVHDAALSTAAQNWAATIAPSGALRHNPNLGSQAGGWTAMAENLGMGPSVDAVHQQLVVSPNHYANMTDRRFTRAGAGVVASGGRVYVVQVFMNGAAASPVAGAPAPTPPAPPATRPPAPPASAPPAPAPTTPPPPVEESDPDPGPPVAPSEPSKWFDLVLERTLRGLNQALASRG